LEIHGSCNSRRAAVANRAEVRRIRELLQRSQFAPALSAAQVLLAEVPENRDVLYMLAVAQRYLQRIPEALATLERLGSCTPTTPASIRSGATATWPCAPRPRRSKPSSGREPHPALPASWKVLQTLYRMAGRAVDADQRRHMSSSLRVCPPRS